MLRQSTPAPAAVDPSCSTSYLQSSFTSERVNGAPSNRQSRRAARRFSKSSKSHVVRLSATSGHSQEDLIDLLRSFKTDRNGPGEVYLVGTGPGDPSLLTIRAVQVMQSAEVVLYDRLVSPEILKLVNPSATMVYVGKNRGFHTRTQPEIHELLCHFAEKGSRVLRLKGGDPFVFGRGGEEMQYLQERGIKVFTVPGITAASGISAELGIPLTHRGLATSVAFITGHAREGGEDELDETVAASADKHTTLVVYMGLNTLPALLARLGAAGLSNQTPAVAVERGTTASQRAVYAPLHSLNQEVTHHDLKSPTLVIIGDVVALSPGWHLAAASGQSLQDGRSYDPSEMSGLVSRAQQVAASQKAEGKDVEYSQ